MINFHKTLLLYLKGKLIECCFICVVLDRIWCLYCRALSPNLPAHCKLKSVICHCQVSRFSGLLRFRPVTRYRSPGRQKSRFSWGTNVRKFLLIPCYALVCIKWNLILCLLRRKTVKNGIFYQFPSIVFIQGLMYLV